MDKTDRELLLGGLRHDIPTFIHRTFQTVALGSKYHSNWHIDSMVHHFQQCLEGKRNCWSSSSFQFRDKSLRYPKKMA